MSHFEQILPDDRVAEVAMRVLKSRLEAVARALPLAARHAGEDAEHVHELRAASRRAVAALDLFASLLPRRRARRLVRLLQRIRSAAGKARDSDVLLARFRTDADATSSIQHHIERSRRRAQKPLIKIDEGFRKTGRLARRIERVLAKVFSRTQEPDVREAPGFGVWAGTELAPRVDAFFAASLKASLSEAKLHRFRISGKNLRYAIEVLAGAFPIDLSRDLYPVIKLVQGKTGEITDHSVACARLEKRSDRLSSRRKAAAVTQLLRAEQARLGAASRAFSEWLTPGRSDELHGHFLALLPTLHEEINHPS